MKPSERENKRYKEKDHCKIKMEERLMFQALEKYSENTDKKREELKVLDIGCGSGLVTKKIKELGYQTEGLDFSEEAVKKATLNGISASVCDLDEGINKSDGSYDVVWAGDIVEHVFDPIGLLKEANRALKNGGIIIMCIPSDVGLVSRMKMLFGYSHQELIYKKTGYYKHHTFFNLRLASFMLNQSNFEIREIKKLLILNKKRYVMNFLPSAFYNELVITARK